MRPSRLARFAHGARLPLRGLRILVGNPGLWPWAIAPVLLALGLVLVAAWLTIAWTPDLVAWFMPAAPTPLLAALRNAISITLGLFLFVAAALVLYASIGVLGTPFYDRLSQTVEDQVRGGPEEPFTWGVFLRDVSRSAWHSVLSLGLWLGVMVALGALNLVPVLGSIVEFLLSLLATSLFVAREMMDGTLSRRRMSYRDKLAFIRAHLVECVGFGAVVGLTLAIPLVNLLALPAGIAAGTLLVLDLEASADEG